MTYAIAEVKNYFREQVRNNPQLRNVNPDRLTLASLALNVQKRFYEGYFGEKRVAQALREGEELRRKDPVAYARALEGYAPYHAELRAMGINTVRTVETLVSSDLAYAIGSLRDAERVDNRPTFTTDLYDLVKRRVRNDLRPIKTQSGVTLADRLLRVRAENTTHLQTSWVARGENYTMANVEIGTELTWEAILNDELDEYGDVVFEFGQAAARTRVWGIVDAIRRNANFVRLPDGGLGPNMDNIEWASNYLGQQVVDGATYSRNLTDIFVPGFWRAVANKAVSGQTVVIVGGANGDVQRVNPGNPAANTNVHVEEILAELPVDPADYDTRQSNRDWIAADPGRQPVEFSVHTLFAAGPRILTRLPDVVELDSMGSFADHVIETKITDLFGAEVRDKTAVLLVGGNDAA